MLAVVALLATVLLGGRELLERGPGAGPDGTSIWPGRGQAAIAVTTDGHTQRLSHDDEDPAPIASMSKVMTAYVVLLKHPLSADGEGYPIQITEGEAADTADRKRQGQSVVPVRAGEVLTEREALEGLLLPSANNLAAVLAVREAGSEARFVQWMNAAAAELGMSRTLYTDPSGFAETTVSTASDQVRLARAAMAVPAFATIVGQARAVLPSAGSVRNTDELVGRDGFVGIKTGSLAAAGGCFMFQNERIIDGRRVVIVGVVMGQQSRDLVKAGQKAAQRMVVVVDDQLQDGGLASLH